MGTRTTLCPKIFVYHPAIVVNGAVTSPDQTSRPMCEPCLLDLPYLARQTFGDRALERDLLALFDQQCVRLRPAVAEGGEALHTLKGAARALGAWRVASLAQRLESALEDGSPAAALRRHAQALEAAIEQTRAALARRLDGAP